MNETTSILNLVRDPALYPEELRRPAAEWSEADRQLASVRERNRDELIRRTLPEYVVGLSHRAAGGFSPRQERELDLYADAAVYILASIEAGRVHPARGADVRRLIEWKKQLLDRGGVIRDVVATTEGDEQPSAADVPSTELGPDVVARLMELCRAFADDLSPLQRSLLSGLLGGETVDAVSRSVGLGRRATHTTLGRIRDAWARRQPELDEEEFRSFAMFLALALEEAAD